MNQRNTLLLAAIGNKRDQDAFSEALSSLRIKAQVRFVPGYAELKAYLLSTQDKPSTNSKPSLILLLAELEEPNSLALIKEIKSLEHIRQVPLIVVSKQHDENQLKSAYRLGAASVIKHPAHFDSIVKILQILDEYWFKTVKLPADQRQRI